MSAVASAFSNFASMPAQQNETLNVVEVVELALDIFNEDDVTFESEGKGHHFQNGPHATHPDHYQSRQECDPGDSEAAGRKNRSCYVLEKTR